MSSPPVVRTLPATTLGRYLLEGPDGVFGAEAPLLVGFHGYGENAEKHLDALRRIPGREGWRRAAIQALHRFYNLKTREVVGSWMTSLDREQAIRDNVAYVASVARALRDEFPHTSRIVYVGFSQGTAMAYRAAASADSPTHGLIALAGDVPPDLAEDEGVRLPPVLIGRGRKDDWYTEAKMARDLDVLEGRAARVETVVFDGGHEWGEEFLRAAGDFLARLLAAPNGS
jgi:predicted esterase